MTLPRPIRGILEFIAANCFLLAMLLAGAGVFWLCGAAITLVFADPDAVPWAWAIALAAAIAATGISGMLLHRFISAFLRYFPSARSRSGPRSGAAVPGSHHHS